MNNQHICFHRHFFIRLARTILRKWSILNIDLLLSGCETLEVKEGEGACTFYFFHNLLLYNIFFFP